MPYESRPRRIDNRSSQAAPKDWSPAWWRDETHFQVAIVGAGFAGLACARVLASRGISTVLLERKAAPEDNPHTTGILVKEVADEWDVPEEFTKKLHGVRLYSPSKKFVDLQSPGYYFLATNVPVMMRWLADETTAAGATILPSNPFRGAARVRDKFWLESAEITCRFLVGADGVQSEVSRDFNLGTNRTCLIGVEVEYEGVRGVEEDLLHCFLDSRLAPGYIGWVIPGVGITQIGLACQRRGKPELDRFVDGLTKLFDFRRARIVGRRGGLIPVGGTVRPLGCEDALLVGDAAGLVSPLTAGGIHTALHFGRRAGQLISDYLMDGGRQPYRALADEIPAFYWKKLLRLGMNLGLPNPLLNLALGNAAFRSLAQMIFYHHRGLFSPAAWRETIPSLR
ncbi:MAG TPA: NAD(P)/FAD-dependent oxidoreductase [Verrucomicrobiae bacterium]|nr:NAD(P)/FAD-dependent oxidoreductase [Verrucomicrobiae bacterium]